MRAWWTTAYYELIKYSRMRSVLIVLIGLPLVLILLLGSAFDTEIKPSKVALFTADHGEMRASIDSFWKDEAIAPYIKVVEAGSEKEVQDFVREGIADYGVYIPANYSELLKAGETAKWLTYSGRYEEKNIAADAVVNRYLANVNLRLAAIETLGPELAASLSGAGSQAEASKSHIASYNLGSGDSQEFGETSAIQYYSAAYLIMFLLYGGMSAGLALLNQRESGTLQRMYAIPSSFRAIVFGIIVGAGMLAALQTVIIVAFTSYVYGVDWGSHLGLITLICLLTAAAGAGLSITIASFARTRKTTQTLFTIIVFSMTFLSGGMMTGIEKMVGGANKLTINHWANVSLRTLMSGTDTSAVWNGIGILGVIALAFTIIAVIRLPKVVKQHA
ncbi:ABC transporter permease [Paenibacillus sp. FJAT-27812]|uniref:ABC transporter permease n=1 Tax=Paenibacillus sp. FJAT-27812 TaxID=1684143 RepID=UPI0006A75948|nr:ABC transporter permease [Paenibacillus sp. FJAT-27812]